ncbi:glycosyltransferase family 2 protein [Candidatus Uhrbacteria bacterium]|nr:glycosyltransferase family 2 protein [Candidatus Uhrbacteria bacterium]
MASTVSINIVAWNSMSFIPDLMKSIMAQTYRDFNVLVIDNGSTDGVGAFLREHYPDAMTIRNARNLGFSAAHNQGIRYALEHWDASEANARFILVTNPDILLTPTFLEELMAAARAHPEAGSFGGKLLRAFGENLSDEVMKETIHSDRIDSTGLRPHRNLTVTDRGAGELDQGHYDALEPVFGVSGALALYRGGALQEARQDDEIFDQDFFAYKEDVDLAWRLQQLGWDAIYVPQAKAYHYRGMYGPEKTGMFQKLKNWRSKPAIRNYLSTRNHWLMLIKNIQPIHALLALPWALPHEVARFLYVAVFDQGIKASFSVLRLLPSLFKKRSLMRAKRRRPARELRRWFI